MRTYDAYKKEILGNDDISAEYNVLEDEYKIIEEKSNLSKIMRIFYTKSTKNNFKMI